MRATTPFWSRPMTETTARLRCVMGGAGPTGSPLPPPLLLVRGDLLGTRLGFLLVRGHLELITRLEHLVVQLRIVGEHSRDGRLLEDRLPGAFGFTGAAVDAFVRVNVELL